MIELRFLVAYVAQKHVEHFFPNIIPVEQQLLYYMTNKVSLMYNTNKNLLFMN